MQNARRVRNQSVTPSHREYKHPPIPRVLMQMERFHFCNPGFHILIIYMKRRPCEWRCDDMTGIVKKPEYYTANEVKENKSNGRVL